jgi:hypothetical protein
MDRFDVCSRCGREALELLRTHSFCWECSHSPEPRSSLASWFAIEFRRPKRKSSNLPQLDHLYWAGFRGIV